MVEAFTVSKILCIFWFSENAFSQKKTIIRKCFTFLQCFIFLASETIENDYSKSLGATNAIVLFYLRIQQHFERWNQSVNISIVAFVYITCRFVYFILTICTYTSESILSLSEVNVCHCLTCVYVFVISFISSKWNHPLFILLLRNEKRKLNSFWVR